MRLSESARARLENFLRRQLRDDRIALGELRVHGGPLVDWFTRVAGVAAITFGRRVFVSREFLRRDSRTGRLKMPGALLAHEATHVAQYRRLGRVKFLAGYLREYFRHLYRQRSLSATARYAAYLSIPHEVEALRVEEAYDAWRRAKD